MWQSDDGIGARKLDAKRAQRDKNALEPQNCARPRRLLSHYTTRDARSAKSRSQPSERLVVSIADCNGICYGHDNVVVVAVASRLRNACNSRLVDY